MIAVLDLGVSNLGSLCRALRAVGAEPWVVVEMAPDQGPRPLIVPGVGSFMAGMGALRRKGQDRFIAAAVEAGAPVLGICLGMQLLATAGQEGGEIDGLHLVPGYAERLEPRDRERIPHVGWNEVLIDKPSPLLEGIPSGTDAYFTHSYALTPRDDADAIAFTPYAGGFTSVVQRGRVFGVQFHPEKSSAAGLQLLRNFVELAS